MAVQKFRRYNLSGSQVCNVNPLTLKEEDAELLRNVTTETLGTLQKRPGTKLRGSQAVNDVNILGVHYYIDSAENTASTFVVADDGTSPTNADIYIEVSSTLNGAITTASTTITLASATNFASSGTVEIDGDLITYTGKSGNNLTGVTGIAFNHGDGMTVRQWSKSLENDTASLRTRFKNFLDRGIRVNGTDAMKCWNGATWETTGNPINPQQATAASLVEIFGDRVFLAGGTLFPDRLYGSSLPSTAGNITWTTSVSVIDKTGTNGFYIDINPEDGQNITALERNGTNLLIFKERSMYTWNGSATQADVLVDIGAVSQEAVTTVHNITFFLGRSKKNLGIYAYTGGYPKLISRRVKKWIDAISQADLTTIKSGADEDNVYFYVGNITFTGDSIYGTRTFNNVWLVYTISQDSWKVYTELHSKCFGHITSSGQELLVFGDNDGKLWELGQGQTDDSGDAQTAIQMEIITREESFGAPEYSKELLEVDVLSRNAQSINFDYRYDRREDWKNLGECSGRTTNFDAPEKYDDENRGNTLQLKITDTSKYQAMLDGFCMTVDLSDEVIKERGGK
jgi:hypothetical protein